MARYGQRPENALKRANEFIEVGKPIRALDTLYEVFKNKKWAYNWSESVLEPIMFKYLDLCVELKKSHIAKEGLFQYRNMFQSVNVGSLENVIRGYLKTAEDRTEAAREQSQQAVIDIDDLDYLASPESILLSAVSGEDAQDRSDRTILTPWVKFLWESYCQCLELLRTNAHVETLYHDIARMAYQFCLKYNRKTEFRKLCEKLRKHLEDISKLPVLVANVSLNKPETQQFNLDTRLVQLDCAIQMELWQEAYKATEDIFGLMILSKKPPVPKTMANYYHKLAMVFWKAGYYLFHAAALFKLFHLSKDMKKNMTADELQRMACRVLLATLSIPLPSAHPEFDRFIETDKSPLEKAQRLAILLTLPQPPTRASLLKDIVRLNVVGLASPPLQELYNCLEVDFSPLTLCKQVTAVCDGLVGEESRQYVPPLQDVTLVRLIRQVSQVYQTIKFSRLLELAHFTTPFHMERLLVECVRHNDMQIRIEHGTGCVHFGIDLAESQREDHSEGPTLQDMPSEQVRNQLINMSTVLHKSLQITNPSLHKVERDRLRQNMVQYYFDTRLREHQRILARHKIIEDRKEQLERMNSVREEEEARRAEELARQQALAEHRRLEQEREERERKRQENEMQQIKDRHLKEKMQQISQTSHGQKVLKKLDEDEIKKMDAEQIAAKEAEELQKERKEMQQKLKSQEKKVDYFERAKRLEEIPLMKKAFEEKEIQDKNFWEQQEAERLAMVNAERKMAVEHRERLARMLKDHDAFLEKINKQRNAAFQEKLKEFEAKLAEERRKRLLERRAKRKEERRAEWIEECAEEAKRKEEEEQKKREEEERLRKEEEDRLEAIRKAEEAEKYRKEKELRDKQAEIARQREEEAIRKQEEKEKAMSATWRNSRDEEKRSAGGGRAFERGEREQRRDEDTGSSWRRSDVKPSEQAWKPKSLTSRTTDDRRTNDDERDDRGPRDRDRFGGRDFGRDGDRDRRDGDRDRRDGDRDRRDMDRDRRDGDRDRRDGDRDRRDGDRDRRDFGRDRDRGFGGRDDRDRFQRDDRDRFPRDRDDRDSRGFGSRGGYDRPSDRDRGKEMSSWRSRDAEPESDSRGPPPRRAMEERSSNRSPMRRDDRRGDDRRAGGDDRRGGEERRGDVWRSAKAEPPAAPRAPPPEPKPAPAPVAAAAPAEDQEDSSWKKVGRR